MLCRQPDPQLGAVFVPQRVRKAHVRVSRGAQQPLKHPHTLWGHWGPSPCPQLMGQPCWLGTDEHGGMLCTSATCRRDSCSLG